MMCLKSTGLVVNSVEPVQMAHSVASDLAVPFAQVYLNTYGKYHNWAMTDQI